MPVWLPRVAALLLLVSTARAQSSVQLMLSGHVQPETGTSIDIEFGIRGTDGAESQTLALHMTLLQNTSATDLAALLDARLAEAKIRHVPPALGGERSLATLFVEGVTRVQVRVSDGLAARIGIPERAPTSVLLLPPLARRGAGALKFHGTTLDARLRQRGNVDFAIDLPAESTPTMAVESLANACSRANWLSERPSHETWKPSVSFEGLELVGTSFGIDSSNADWGLELSLP